jgi:D-alanyl-lipoteichoic acid acyltransferase DltB (MBOAT superfamily)
MLQTLSIGPELLASYLVFCVVVALIVRALPAAYRKPALLLGSFLFAQLYIDVVIGLFVLGSALALFTITRFLPAGRPRLAAGAALLALVYLPFCFSGVVIVRVGEASGYWLGCLVLLVVFFKRAIYYLYEVHYGRVRPLGLVDFLVSFLSLPFLLGRAPVVAHQHFAERARPLDWRLARRAGWTILLAVVHLAALAVLTRRLVDVPMDAHLAMAAPQLPWAKVWLILGLNYLAFYLFRYGHDQLSVGAARLMGFDIDDNYANPLAACDYADFWRRWNIHFRQMLVSMTYYPTVLRLSRANPKRKALNILGACVVVFTVHGLFMVFTLGMFVPWNATERWLELGASLLIYELLQVLLTAGSLLLLGRKHRTGPWRWVGIPLGVATTYALRSVMLLFIWRRSMDLGGAFIVLLALLP